MSSGNRTTSLQIGNYTLDREVLSDLTKLRRPFPKAELAPDDSMAVDTEHEPDKSLEDKFQFITRMNAQRKVRPFPIPNWPDERETTYPWKLHEWSQNEQTGYDGALFSTEINGQKQYFIYSLCANDTGDLGTIGLIMNGERPEQAANAQAFSDACVAKIQKWHPGEDVPIIHVGYSLGGAITELVDRKGRPTVVFDSPPVSAVHDRENVPQAKRDENLLTIMGPHDAIFNSHGRHNGEILVAGEKFWKTEHVSFNDFWRLNEANHELSVLGKALDSMDEWKPFPAAEWERPTHLVDAFANYLEENTENRKPRWDEALLIKQVKLLQSPQGKHAAEGFARFVFDKAAKVFGSQNAEAAAGKFTAKIRKERGQQASQPGIHPDVDKEAVRQPVLGRHSARAMQEDKTGAQSASRG